MFGDFMSPDIVWILSQEDFIPAIRIPRSDGRSIFWMLGQVSSEGTVMLPALGHKWHIIFLASQEMSLHPYNPILLVAVYISIYAIKTLGPLYILFGIHLIQNISSSYSQILELWLIFKSSCLSASSNISIMNISIKH